MKHQRDDDQVLSFSDNNSANVNLALSLGISNELASHHYPNEKIENDPPPFNQLNTQSAKHYERGSEKSTYEMINRGNYGLSNNYGSFNILNVELPQNHKVGSFGNFSGDHNLLPTSDHISLNHFGNKNSSVIGDESQFHTPPDNAGGNNFESSELPQTPNLQNYAVLPSNSSRQRGSRRREIIYNDPNKKCTKCDNNNTPMWRKGPFGPRSLCNACGIKYRKGKGKKKIEEATANEQ